MFCGETIVPERLTGSQLSFNFTLRLSGTGVIIMAHGSGYAPIFISDSYVVSSIDLPIDLGEQKRGNMRGGQNRKHDYTARYKRLDSFEYGKCVPLIMGKNLEYFEHTVSWKDGKAISIVLFPDRLNVGYKIGNANKYEEIRESFYFSPVENNYGGTPRMYFNCPECQNRCRYLYLHRRHFKCRKCASLVYSSQQVTKNSDQAADRIQKLLRDKFKITDDLCNFDAAVYIPPRPKGMHDETYYNLLVKLNREQELFWDRCARWLPRRT